MGFATWELYTHFKPRKVKYTRSIVSYLDILGFGGLIETRRPGEISRILRILSESVRPEPIFKSEKIKLTKFSDTVIRSMPATTHYPRDLVFELRSLLNAQIALISEGILIRGAVTVGDIVQSWRIVYGPAIVKAHALESLKGSPPRVVVDEKALMNEGESCDSELADLLTYDGPIAFLDYLRACEAEFNVPEQEYPLFLKLHRDLIRIGLMKYALDPGILQKYQWLKDYHDRNLERLGIDLTRHLLV
jgi:hypothetical protein